MTLWEDFSADAAGRDVTGYFERAPSLDQPSGFAFAFDRVEELRPLTAGTDVAALERDTNRFLREPRSAVVGYAGFDAVRLFEPATGNAPAGSPFPLGELAWVRRGRFGPARGPGRLRLRTGRVPAPIRDTLPPRAFGRSVRRLVESIRDGQAFQVVLAHRREWDRPDDLLTRADRLRSTERFAYFYYLKFGDREIVGATPESVAEVDGGRAYVNPIAGTLPTGRRPNRRLPLRQDPKELAEHRMLVDLARNDLGRVSRPGSVRLVWEERRQRYARLEHLVSRVGGTLRSGVGPWETLAATFPAGTVSGAPKIRATQLLRDQERTWRGPYGGAVALMRPHGRAEFALAIRTAFGAGRRLYTAAGAGIVHRSRPAREFDETLAKLAHVEAALVGEAP
ncbi:MAG TPA: anthranilate synthase component I family protein [Thermoplasmata archaeon]|nr:anthranilate synthase component I family protein [Thermoplasmata archaeon]